MKLFDLIEKQIKGSWGEDASETLPNTPVIKTNNMTYEGRIVYDNVPLRYIQEKKLSELYLKTGDILIEKSGGTKTHSVGYACYFDGESDKYICNNFILGLRVNPDIANPRYCFYQIKYKYESGLFSDCYNKTTGIQNLKIDCYLGKEIRYHSEDEQRRIVHELDAIIKCIDIKQTTLNNLDNLVKSRFIEMFGDITTNSKRLPTKRGKELFVFSSGKGLPVERRYDSGVPVYGGNGIAWYTDSPLIDHSTIVIGRVGAYCGNIHIILEPAWITDNAIYIKQFKTDDFDIRFLSYLMDNANFLSKANKSAQPKITQKPLEDFEYIIPDIKQQKAFSKYEQQIDKSKFRTI